MEPSEILFVIWMASVLVFPGALAQPATPEIEDNALVPCLTIRSELGVTNVIEYAEALATNQWLVLSNLVVTANPYVVVDLASPATKRFYRVVMAGITNVPPDTNVPGGMVLIPAGSFTMGNTDNEVFNAEIPTHTVYVGTFYMDRYEVTKALWDEVYTWAMSHGYSFDNAGSGKAANHPVQTVNWYDVVKWCNARSEKVGLTAVYYTDAAMTQVYRSGQVELYANWVARGYRLPTEAEWEKAARGGVSGHRFPWSNVDTITQSQANYYSFWSGGKPVRAYDLNPTEGYHPNYQSGGLPYTSPVGSFAPNAYGLYDMAGNAWEWCWDWWDSTYYSSSPWIDPRGPVSGSDRVLRGSSWNGQAPNCRVAYRGRRWPDDVYYGIGFRCILPPGLWEQSVAPKIEDIALVPRLIPEGMVLIPAGSFTMGNTFNDGGNYELPLHTVYVSAFYMDRYEVTKALWDEVYTWATSHGYSFDNAGSGKAANHPVQTVNWYDVVKWCNARSQKEGRVPAYYTDAAQTTVYQTGPVNVQNDWVKWNAGYRLPTEAEWEKAARGGVSRHRFPWSNVDTITHSQANYRSTTSDSYDVSSTRGFHPNC